MSYGPFLGGRRICLGKTFAEAFAKSVLSVIITQLDFDFVDADVRDVNPANNFFDKEPIYRMKASLAKY
jgi:cytochrome P450